MLAPTHSLFGIFLTLIILALFGIPSSLHWSILLFAVIGSLAPDLDHPKSVIGKIFFFISKPLDKRFGHRTVTHSLIGWVVASVIGIGLVAIVWAVYALLETQIQGPLPSITFGLAKRWVAAFSIGYFSHIMLDMLNPRGAQLFWPNPGRDVALKDPNLRPETGAKAEIVIFLVLALLLVFAFPLSKYGAASSLRWLLATPEAAIEEFKTATTKSFIEFNGMFTDTRAPVAGKAEIIDAKNKKLIVLYDRQVYTMSDELAADILAKKTRVEKTDIPIVTDHKVFEHRDREYLLKQIPDGALVSGVIRLPKDMSVTGLQKGVEQVGDELRLTHATKANLNSLAWDESFALMQRQDKSRLQKLRRDVSRSEEALKHVDDSDGLTPLGASLLLTDADRREKEQKRDDLKARLEALRIDIEELEFKIKQNELRFSGDVTIRH